MSGFDFNFTIDDSASKTGQNYELRTMRLSAQPRRKNNPPSNASYSGEFPSSSVSDFVFSPTSLVSKKNKTPQNLWFKPGNESSMRKFSTALEDYVAQKMKGVLSSAPDTCVLITNEKDVKDFFVHFSKGTSWSTLWVIDQTPDILLITPTSFLIVEVGLSTHVKYVKTKYGKYEALKDCLESVGAFARTQYMITDILASNSPGTLELRVDHEDLIQDIKNQMSVMEEDWLQRVNSNPNSKESCPIHWDLPKFFWDEGALKTNVMMSFQRSKRKDLLSFAQEVFPPHVFKHYWINARK